MKQILSTFLFGAFLALMNGAFAQTPNTDPTRADLATMRLEIELPTGLGLIGDKTRFMLSATKPGSQPQGVDVPLTRIVQHPVAVSGGRTKHSVGLTPAAAREVMAMNAKIRSWKAQDDQTKGALSVIFLACRLGPMPSGLLTYTTILYLEEGATPMTVQENFDLRTLMAENGMDDLPECLRS